MLVKVNTDKSHQEQKELFKILSEKQKIKMKKLYDENVKIMSYEEAFNKAFETVRKEYI